MSVGTDRVTEVVNRSMEHVANDPTMRAEYCVAEEDVDAKRRGICDPTWWEASDDVRIAIARIWFGNETFDALARYAGALERVLRAETGEPLGIAILNLSYALGALQDATATLPGSGFSQRSRVIVSSVGSFLINAHPDLARGEALTQAVVAADPVIATLVELVATDVQMAHRVQLAHAPGLSDGTLQYAAANDPEQPADNADEISAEALASMLNRSDPTEALRRLAIAHDMLRRAVIDGSTQSFDQMVVAVDEFARSAELVFIVYAEYLEVLSR